MARIINTMEQVPAVSLDPTHIIAAAAEKEKQR